MNHALNKGKVKQTWMEKWYKMERMHSEMNAVSICNICDGFFEIKAELENET